MYRFAANLASKARVAEICTQSGRSVITKRSYFAPKLGKEGVITSADGKAIHNGLEVVDGVKLNRGYVSARLITNPENDKCELDDPFVLIHEKKISDVNAIEKVVKGANKRQRPLLIIAGDVDDDVMTTLIYDKIKVCAVRAPGENRKAILQDLATLTGSELFSEDLGIKLEEVKLKMLGSCKRVTVSNYDTVIQDGAGNKKLLKERCEQIRSAIELSTSVYEREKLQERLAKLSGGVLMAKFYKREFMVGDHYLIPPMFVPQECTEDDEMNWKIDDLHWSTAGMFERECHLNPNIAGNFRRWGIALMGSSWFSETVNYQRSVLTDAITKLEKALSLDPNDYKSKQRLTEAYEQLVQLCVDSELFPVGGEVSSINENKCMQDDEMVEASMPALCNKCQFVGQCDSYIVDPCVRNWKYKGITLMKLSRKESGTEKRALIAEAIEKFEKALELKPDDNETKQQLVEAYDQILTKKEVFRNVLPRDLYSLFMQRQML